VSGWGGRRWPPGRGGWCGVFHSGTRSWQLVQSVEELLHVVLHTRALLGLPPEAGSPPPLRGGPDPQPGLLAANRAAAAGVAWRGWWDAHVARAAVLQGVDRVLDAPAVPGWVAGVLRTAPAGRPEDPDLWEAWADWRGQLLDSDAPAGPPDFLGLDPLLRPAAVGSWPAAQRWSTTHARGMPGQGLDLPWGVAAGAAAAVGFDHGVDPGEVRGVLLPPAVTGLWWQQWGPGIVLCSADALTDPATARAVVYTALAGRLRA